MSLAIQYHMKRKKMAKGGEAKKDKEYSMPNWNEKGVHQPFSSRAVSEDYHKGFVHPDNGGPTKAKKNRHRENLAELKSMSGPTSGKSGFAEGGDVCMHCGGSMPGYAEGGMVDDLPMADFEPNQFDYLDTHDDEEAEDDLVSRVMKKRKRA